MKLVGETDHSLGLPGDPQKQPSPIARLARKLLHWVTSSKGITVLIGGLFFVLMSLLMSLNYFGASPYVNTKGISLQDVYAESLMEVEDTAETKRKIERARQNVPPIYKNPTEWNRSMHASLEHLLADLRDLTSENLADSTAEQQRIDDLVSENPQIKGLLERIDKRNPGPEYWDKISAVTHETLNRVIRKGITPNDYLERREQIINAQLPSASLNRLDADIIRLSLYTALQPNRIEDEKAMDKKREEAANTVQPATRLFRKGERIVSAGEAITPVQIAALQKMGKPVVGNNWAAATGIILLVFAFTITLWAYLYYFNEKRFFHPAYAALLGTLIFSTTLGLQILIQSVQSGNLSQIVIYGFPMAMLALTISIFTHPRIGLMATFLTAALINLVFRLDFSLIAVLLFGSAMGIYILSRRMNFRDRGQLMYAGLYIGFTNVVLIFAINLLESTSLLDTPWGSMAQAIGWGFLSGVLSGILALGTLPFLESLFRLVTPYTLMELANHDKPLLKRMQFEAPGTFHHSLMVASLSEAAAESVGADALMTRVGCLYHDIGKMKRPLFFIENQAYFGAENPHDKLTPRLSKMVITAHPKDSVEMARQYRIPECIQRFMTEHHGTMMAGYFYNKACQEEGAENVNKSQFRYPGPKPQSKETAIVMLADACESAVRALKNPTVAQIEERIDKIIWQRIEDGQFDNCPLTFKDISIIKTTFVRVLRGIQHNRIEYQQNIMRDLGRKMQTVKAAEPGKPDPAKIEAMLKDIQQSSGGSAGSSSGDGY